jgi:hypothetical protein
MVVQGQPLAKISKTSSQQQQQQQQKPSMVVQACDPAIQEA